MDRDNNNLSRGMYPNIRSKRKRGSVIKRLIIFELTLILLCCLYAFYPRIDAFLINLPYKKEFSEVYDCFMALNVVFFVLFFGSLSYSAYHVVKYTPDAISKSDVLPNVRNLKTIDFSHSIKSIKKYESIDSDIIRTEYVVAELNQEFSLNPLLWYRMRPTEVYYYKPLGVYFISDLHTDVFGSDRTLFVHRERARKVVGVSDIAKEFILND